MALEDITRRANRLGIDIDLGRDVGDKRDTNITAVDADIDKYESDIN